MSRLPLLPKWVLPPTLPSVYDSESATALEMVAKCYGATSAMIEEYNSWVDEINAVIETFTGSSTQEIENFKKTVEERLRCKFEDLDNKMGEIKAEMLRFAAQHIENMEFDSLPPVSSADTGKLMQVVGGVWSAAIPAFVYDPETESLDFTLTGGVNNE